MLIPQLPQRSSSFLGGSSTTGSGSLDFFFLPDEPQLPSQSSSAGGSGAGGATGSAKRSIFFFFLSFLLEIPQSPQSLDASWAFLASSSSLAFCSASSAAFFSSSSLARRSSSSRACFLSSRALALTSTLSCHSLSFFSYSFLALRLSLLFMLVNQVNWVTSSGSGSSSDSGSGSGAGGGGGGTSASGSGSSRLFFLSLLEGAPQAPQSSLASSAGADPRSPKSNPPGVLDLPLPTAQGLLSLDSSFGGASPIPPSQPEPGLLLPVFQSFPQPPKPKPVPPDLAPESKLKSNCGAPSFRPTSWNSSASCSSN